MRTSLDRMSSRLDMIERKLDALEVVMESKLDQMTILIDLRFDGLMELIKSKQT
jgi:hypothetical protein